MVSIQRVTGGALGRLRRVASAAAGPVNLTGPLGVGKSTLVRAWRDALVVDFDDPQALSRLRQARAVDGAMPIADNVDGEGRLATVDLVLEEFSGPLIIVTRSPLNARVGRTSVPTVSLSPLRDDEMADTARAAAVPERDVAAVVQLAAGIPLLAAAAARGLRRGLAAGPGGPLADHVAREVLDRLGRELPGYRWRSLLEMLATVRAGDQALMRISPHRFDALADVSVVVREPSGLAIAEPYRSLLEAAYRWRDPGTHEKVEVRASAYRRERLERAVGIDQRVQQLDQALYLHGDEAVRTALYPPGRPPLPIRSAGPTDEDEIGRLMRRWADERGFDRSRCDRLAEQWIADDVTGFQLIEDDSGIVGLTRLVQVNDRTRAGVEPLLQQHATRLLTGDKALFLGASFCAHPVAHAQLLRHIIGSALVAGRVVVSTGDPHYQALLRSLRFIPYGGIRDDAFRCGRPPVVFSNDFTKANLPRWLGTLRSGGRPDPLPMVAWALSRLRSPELAHSPLLDHSSPAAVDRLRERLIASIQSLAQSSDPLDAESGQILTAHYLSARPPAHVQSAARLHLSRATYFRRLSRGHAAIYDALQHPIVG